MEGISRDAKMVTRETLGWIEAVTGRRFSPEAFRENLEDGVALCELIEVFSPGSIRKISRTDSPMAHLDNLQQFFLACKDMGLRDEQLFNLTDLQEPHDTQSAAGAGDKRAEAERNLRNVCVTLYWLGRLVAERTEYKGPQLDFGAFRTLLHNQAGSDASSSTSDLPSHPSSTSLPGNSGLSGEGENGLGLTFEEEQTADQLLADIQSAVDEMLHDFQTSPITMEEDSYSPLPPPPPPLPPYQTIEDPHSSVPPPFFPSNGQDHGVMRVEVSVHMKSAGQGKGFGFQVSGGVDTGQAPQVDMVLPGSAAELSGLRQDDVIVSVNQDNVGSLSHHQLVATIRKAGREGFITLGLSRVQEAGEGDLQATCSPQEVDWHEERERQAQELIQAYPKAHRYLESSAPTLTPVLEEEIGNYTGDSPQLLLPAISPEMAAVISAKGSVEELRSLEEQMRKNTPSLISPLPSPPPPP